MDYMAQSCLFTVAITLMVITTGLKIALYVEGLIWGLNITNTYNC